MSWWRGLVAETGPIGFHAGWLFITDQVSASGGMFVGAGVLAFIDPVLQGRKPDRCKP